MQSPTKQRTAMVMGGSIAGLWAARVLADHFDQVLVIERDQLPAGPEPRGGVPQARQYHILLLRGLQIMRQLFPGLEEELLAAGAVPFDMLNDCRVRIRNRWLPQFPSDQQLISCSRVLIEAHMRARLRQHAGVQFVERTDVAGLQADDGRTRVTGVQVVPHGDPQGERRTLFADLVVDALGRRSPAPEWLVELGYEPPRETVVDSFLGYVTRRYRQPEQLPQGWRMLLLGASPPDQPRGGLIFPEEHGVWVVMMAGVNKDYPPTDEEGFQAFVRSLGPEFAGAVASAEPISRPYGYRGTDSRWRHYERLARFPERLVVLGDAFCGFNPVYGQGMTIAALSAVALGDELQRAGGQLDGIAPRTHRAIGQITQGAWLLATGADLEWPGTVGGEGGNGLADRFGRWYLSRLLDAMPGDPRLRLAFTEVNHLVRPVTALFAPELALRVLTASARR